MMDHSKMAHLPVLCCTAISGFVAGPSLDGMRSRRRMVRELRFAHWEALEPLPRMEHPARSSSSASASAAAAIQQQNSHWDALLPPQSGSFKRRPPPAPDLAAGLLHQKLQMLDCCVWLRAHAGAGFVASPAVHADGSMPDTTQPDQAPGVDAPFARSLSEALLRESGLSEMKADKEIQVRPLPRGMSALKKQGNGGSSGGRSPLYSGSETTAAISALETPDSGSEDFASCQVLHLTVGMTLLHSPRSSQDWNWCVIRTTCTTNNA